MNPDAVPRDEKPREASRYSEDGVVRCPVCQATEPDVEARFGTVAVASERVRSDLPGRPLDDGEAVPVAGYKCPRSDRVLVADSGRLFERTGAWAGKWVTVEVETARGTTYAAVPVAWVRETLLDRDPDDYPDPVADDANGDANQPDADDAPVRTAAVRDAPDDDSDASDDHEPKNPTDADEQTHEDQDDDGQATLGAFAGGEP